MRKNLVAGIAILSVVFVGIPSLAGAKDPVPNLPAKEAPQKAVTPTPADLKETIPKTPGMDGKAAAPTAGTIPGKAPPAPEIKKGQPPTITAPEKTVIKETVPQPQTGENVLPGAEPVVVSRLVRNLKGGKDGEEAEVVLQGKNLHGITRATAAGVRVTIVTRTATEMTLKVKGQTLSLKDLTLHTAFGKPIAVPLREEIKKARAQAAGTQTALPGTGVGPRPEAFAMPESPGGTGPSTRAEAANQPGGQVGKTDLDTLTGERKLKELLASGNESQYRVYMFDKAGNRDKAWRKSWSGHLLLPDPTKNAKPEVVSLTDSTGRPLTDGTGKPMTEWFFRQEDGSLSKHLVDGGGRMAGQLTFAPSRAVLLSLDLDGDQVIDVMDVISPNGREHLVMRDDKGIKDIEQWRQGIERWCLETAERSAGSTETADSRFTISLCRGRGGTDSSSSSSSGTGYTGRPGDKDEGWLDEKCTEILARGRRRGGGIASDDLESYLSTAGRTVLEWIIRPTNPFLIDKETFNGVVDGDADAVDRFGRQLGTHTITSLVYELIKDLSNANKSSSPEKKDPGSQPQVGDTPRSPEEALYNLCLARARNRSLYNIADLDNRQVGQKCPDPKSQPKPTGASAARAQSTKEFDWWCRDDEESRKDPSDMAGLIRGGSSGTGCGITERPGPDGKCQGAGRTVNRGTSGMAGVSLGILYGLPPPVEESPIGVPKPLQ